MRRIVDDAHQNATALLTEHRGQLDALVDALLEHETLRQGDAYFAAGAQRTPTTASGTLGYARVHADMSCDHTAKESA